MQSIRQRLVVNYSLILLLGVFVLEMIFIVAMRQYYLDNIEQILRGNVSASADLCNTYLKYQTLPEKACYILETLEDKKNFAVEVVDANGRVLFNSYGIKMDRPLYTPDVSDALEGEVGTWTGYNVNTKERIMAVSRPLYTYNHIDGVLRFTVSLEYVYELLLKLSLSAIAVGIIIIIIALSFSLFLARSIIKPIQELTLVTEKMAYGDFSVRAKKTQDDEIGKLADAFNFMAEEMMRSEKLKNEFISSISHELRTPLTSIKGWSETIISGNLENQEETMQGLQIISKESDRLTGMVEELLDFSRFQSGRVILHLEEIDINEIIDEVYQQFKFRAQEKNITLKVVKDSNIMIITGDRNRIKQVLINLVDNSLKFSNLDGMIKIESHHRKKGVEFEVIDNGRGIKAYDLPRITEKFYQGGESLPGSGLGLSICKEIINLHHGAMKINSRPGAGTRVRIFLPRKGAC